MTVLAALLLLHLLLIPLGFTLIWLAMRSPVNDFSCKNCGYDLRGSLHSSKQCPECGSCPGDPQAAKRKERANLSLVIVGIVLLAIPLVCDVFAVNALFSLAGW